MKQQINRIFSLLLALTLCLTLFLAAPARVSAEETGGSCGENLTWSFADGHLTITGSGNMNDYNPVELPPWYAFRENVFYLSLPEGLTGVGEMAFYGCKNLTCVTIPSTVTHIGAMAFSQCSSITMLTLNTGLKSIGQSAFEQCHSLRDLRLPDTLESLGYHAFYNCSGLLYVRIPSSVKEMDSGVFAYCANLARAEIAAPLSVVPAWTFYGCTGMTEVILSQEISGVEDNAFVGCEQLETVYYSGPVENAEHLQEQIGEETESFQNSGTVTDTDPGDEGVTYEIGTNEEGKNEITYTTVTQTEDATVSTTVVATEGEETVSVVIEATIITDEGWQELLEEIDENQTQEGQRDVDVHVYVPDGSGVPTEVIDEAADNANVNITVHTGGNQFAVDGSVVEPPPQNTVIHFSYSATRLASPDFEELKGTASYKLEFSHSSDVKMEILIRIPVEFARNVATLYQVDGNRLVLLQSVIVDSLGYAHFYLANIDAEQSYRIGINIPDIKQETIIVPEELYHEYDINTTYPDLSQYALTGPVSSWGMSINQVSMILLAVMVGCAVCIGVFMYIRNKIKLKKGYIPDISEEETEE